MGRTGRAYRRLRSKFTDIPTSFSWVIKGQLAASGWPSSRGQVLWLEKQGVRSILTLTEAALPEAWLEGTGVSARHIAMSDHAPPTMEGLKESTTYIASQLGAGKAVLVHCLAGVGRTGCVLACYLIERDGKSADQAIDEVRALRPRSIEAPQEAAVRDYERRFTRAKR